MKKPTLAEMKRTLEAISRYPIPYYTIDGKQLVPLSKVEEIRQFARNVLRWRE